MSHLESWGAKRLSNKQDLLKLIAQAHAQSPLRGTDAVLCLRRARALWESAPEWQERARAAILEFHASREARGLAVVGGAEVDLQCLGAIREFLDADSWTHKIEAELGGQRALDEVRETALTEALTAMRPLGVLLHVCPGNSYLGGLDSVLHGVVTGNVNIAKLSRNAPGVIPIIQELLEASGLPRGQVSSVIWEQGLESQMIEAVDATVVWGSDEAVRAYRAILPAAACLIEYGPKLSFSVITAQGFVAALADPALLQPLVADVCAFEQASCSSSQVLLLEVPEESGDSASEGAFRTRALDLLAGAFATYAEKSPPVGRGKHQQVELLKSVERAKLQKSRNSDVDLRSGHPDWLLHWKGPAERIEPSPLLRTWLIYPIRSSQRGELQAKLDPVRRYLQTASVLCAPGETHALAEALWSLGVNRVVEPGRSTVATPGAPHDGSYILAQFCRVVSLESPRRSEQLWYCGSDALKLEKLRKLMVQANEAPYYRQLFERSGVSPDEELSWEQFAQLPWLKKEDVYEFGPPLSSEMLTTPYDSVQRAYLFTTGGSTGAPKYALYSRAEWEDVSEIFAKEFRDSGLGPHDRVANLFAGGGLWSAFIATTEGLEKLGCLNLPIGNIDPTQTLELFKSLRATAVFGLPSTLLRLAHLAKGRPDLDIKLSTVLYGGEHMSEPMRKFVGEAFHADTVKSGSYAAVDAGCIGYQCRQTSGGTHHVLESYCHLEICDEESGLPVAVGQAGEIIVTNLSRTLFPVIRLRTGDRGRFLPSPCACGSYAQTFELLGRSDDLVRVGGANVYASDVDKLCQAFPGELSLIYQLRIGKSGVDDRYDLVIEAKDGVSGSQVGSRAQEIREAYLRIAEDLHHFLEQDLLRHFELKIVPAGTIGVNAKTGKIRRVVDLR